jgi:hypothetical protein
VALKLNAQSDTVLSVTRSITRYGITTDDPNKWRYYLDSVEVHFPRPGSSTLMTKTA